MLKTLFLCLYTQTAFAWGTIGHQTIGEIAERRLSPEAQRAVTSILGAEKMAIAAVWPDDVREDPDFDSFKPYHFISTNNDVLAHDPKDSLTILNQYPALLKNPHTPRSVKIAALKYLIHVVGDVHQPMHIGRKSDSGGNACSVLWDKQILSLHQLWDGKIIEADVKRMRLQHPNMRDYGFIQYADDLLLKDITPSLSLNFSEWVQESLAIRDSLYVEGRCQKQPGTLPVIDEDYKTRAFTITEERLLLAGLRLASFLNDIFKDGVNPGPNDSLTKKQILESLSLTNQ